MISISTINQEEYQNQWNQQNYHILQSFLWGNVKEAEGWTIYRLGIFKDGALIDVLSIQSKKIGPTSFGYIPKIKDFQFWKELQQYCNKELLIDFLVIEFDSTISAEQQPPQKGESILENYNDHIQPAYTNIVTLGKSEEELFMNLKGQYRRNIKKAIKDGVLCTIYKAGEASAIDKFYSVLTEVFANTKYLPRPKKYFSNIWHTLSKTNHISIIIAEKDQKPLGAYLIVNDNIGAYELYGGVTRTGRDFEAGYILKWEAIKYFNAIGFSFYDHWGVSKRMPDGSYANDDLHNISMFKEGFGGMYHEFPVAKILVINKQKYRIFKLLKSFQNVWIKLKKGIK